MGNKCRNTSMWVGLMVCCIASYIFISFLHLSKSTSNHSKGVIGDHLERPLAVSNVKEHLANLMWNKPPIKWVVILSYQRCGSSFFGNLFNFDPDAFYVYEPLDGLYTSIYGTIPGWNVPSDIVSYRNGSQRELPDHEINAAKDFLQNLFECDVTSLPTTSIASPFWWMEPHRKLRYGSCLETNKIKNDCYRFSKSVCSGRFDTGNPALERCRGYLKGEKPKFEKLGKSYVRFLAGRFSNYTSCLREKRQQIETGNCLQILREKCVDSRLRVVKLVRGTMKSMRYLLDTNPHLYVIHLVRDPRAVAVSRWEFHRSGRGIYSSDARMWSDKLSREAAIYCRQVVADVVVRRQLEHLFPGRLLAVNYEQVVDDPVSNAEKIYRFLGLPVPEIVVQNFTNLSLKGNRNLTGNRLAKRWQTKVGANLRTKIDIVCSEMSKLYPQYGKSDS